jgi:hypothetical protein
MITTAATTNNRTNTIGFIKILLSPQSYNKTPRALAVSQEYCLSWKTTLFTDAAPDGFRAAAGGTPLAMIVLAAAMPQQSGGERF